MKTNKIPFIILNVIALIVILYGCSSDQEKLVEKQKQTCRADIESGKEPTSFCTNLLPEYRAVSPVTQQVPGNQLPADQQYSQPVQYAPQGQPVIVNQPQPAASTDSGGNMIRDMALGGMLGQAFSGRPSGQSFAAQQQQPTTVIHKTIIQQAPAANQQPQAPIAKSVPEVTPVKAPAMDMSKLHAPTPAAAPLMPTAKPKQPAMDMSKMSQSVRPKPAASMTSRMSAPSKRK